MMLLSHDSSMMPARGEQRVRMGKPLPTASIYQLSTSSQHMNL